MTPERSFSGRKNLELCPFSSKRLSLTAAKYIWLFRKSWKTSFCPVPYQELWGKKWWLQGNKSSAIVWLGFASILPIPSYPAPGSLRCNVAYRGHQHSHQPLRDAKVLEISGVIACQRKLPERWWSSKGFTLCCWKLASSMSCKRQS